MLNVMLIDNHDLIRCGIKYVLKDVKNLHIVCESINCEEAIAHVHEAKPDIAIISLNKFEVSLLDGIQRLMRRMKTLKVLVLTDCINNVILSYLLKSGVHGCLSMNTDQEEMIRAISTIKNGERFVSSDIANFLATSAVVTDKYSPFIKLSTRELQVVLLIIQGLSPKEIAERLFLSSKTISTYRNNIFTKLGVKNEVEMTLLAIMSGLLEVR